MKTVFALLIVCIFIAVPVIGQHNERIVTLDIMSLAVDHVSLDSVPVKVSVPKTVAASELSLSASADKNGDILITGTPYDSVGVRVPSDVIVDNQFSENAQLKGFQILYRLDSDESPLEVLPPVGCIKLQIPQSGRIQLKIGGKIISKRGLRGTYTGSIPLNCDRDSRN